MIIKEEELKNILVYSLKPYFEKYGFKFKEGILKINDKIYLNAVLGYNHLNFEITGSFLLEYKDNYIIFHDIDGIVKYNFIELSIIQVLKQFLKIPQLIIEEKKCLYPIELPIESIINQKKEIKIKIRDY